MGAADEIVSCALGYGMFFRLSVFVTDLRVGKDLKGKVSVDIIVPDTPTLPSRAIHVDPNRNCVTEALRTLSALLIEGSREC